MKRMIILLMLSVSSYCVVFGQWPAYKQSNQRARELTRTNDKLQQKTREQAIKSAELQKQMENFQGPATFTIESPKITLTAPSSATQLKNIQLKEYNELTFPRLEDLKLCHDSLRTELKDSILRMLKDCQVDEWQLCVLGNHQGTILLDGSYTDMMRKTDLSILRAAVYLAVMEQGDYRDAVVDTQDGVYASVSRSTEKADTIYDHNWRRGGYGKMSLLNGFLRNSDIAAVRSVENYLPNGFESLDSALNKMQLFHLNTIHDSRSMCQQKAFPFTMLSWMSSIANTSLDGYSKRSQRMLQEALRLHTLEGFGKWANSEKVAISGMNYVSRPDSAGNMTTAFIGYFPSEAPQYTIYVECKKKGRPVFVSIPTKICKMVAENIMELKNKGDR